MSLNSRRKWKTHCLLPHHPNCYALRPTHTKHTRLNTSTPTPSSLSSDLGCFQPIWGGWWGIAGWSLIFPPYIFVQEYWTSWNSSWLNPRDILFFFLTFISAVNLQVDTQRLGSLYVTALSQRWDDLVDALNKYVWLANRNALNFFDFSFETSSFCTNYFCDDTSVGGNVSSHWQWKWQTLIILLKWQLAVGGIIEAASERFVFVDDVFQKAEYISSTVILATSSTAKLRWFYSWVVPSQLPQPYWDVLLRKIHGLMDGQTSFYLIYII